VEKFSIWRRLVSSEMGRSWTTLTFWSSHFGGCGNTIGMDRMFLHGIIVLNWSMKRFYRIVFLRNPIFLFIP
jgi:hypothetical protein